MQGDDGTNNGHGWSFNATVFDFLRDGGERADDNALIASGAIVNDGHGQVLVGAIAYKFTGQDGELGQPHIDGDSLMWLYQGLPIEIDFAFPCRDR